MLKLILVSVLTIIAIQATPLEFKDFGKSVIGKYEQLSNTFESDDDKLHFTENSLAVFKYLGGHEKQDPEKVKESMNNVKEFSQISPVYDKITDDVAKVMTEPRCGKPDIDEPRHREKRWAQVGTVWQKYPIKLGFKNFLRQQNISPEIQEQVVRECAMMWAEVSSLQFSWANSDPADIEIMFEHFNDPNSPNRVGLAQSPRTDGGQLFLKLATNKIWKARLRDREDGISMKWAICHEMGHNLGLGHSDERNALMFGTMGKYETVGKDDIRGIRSLYGRREDAKGEEIWVGPASILNSRYLQDKKGLSHKNARPTRRRATLNTPHSAQTSDRQRASGPSQIMQIISQMIPRGISGSRSGGYIPNSSSENRPRSRGRYRTHSMGGRNSRDGYSSMRQVCKRTKWGTTQCQNY